MEISKKWLSYLGITLLVVVVFAIGFYYGFRYHEANAETVDFAGVQSAAESIEHVEVTAKEVDGVHWIKAGSDPNCPDDHPIKGKFDSNVCFFYTKENQFYNRVKAHVCFATEEFATESVGCLKKF
jgi:hypothetical protein